MGRLGYAALAAALLATSALGLLVARSRSSHDNASATPAASASPSPTVIDEVHGLYRGVGIGDDVSAVRRVFGKRPLTEMDAGIAPTNADPLKSGPPAFFQPPCHEPEADGSYPAKVLRYGDVSFFVCNRTVYMVMVTAENARTRRGLRIGDDLTMAHAAYKHFRCDEATLGGDGDAHESYCAGAITPNTRTLHIWIAPEPIGGVSISTTPFDGYEQ